jgi:hypothetical protein
MTRKKAAVEPFIRWIRTPTPIARVRGYGATADITRKLDADFLHGRWARATDRQRELLQVVSHLPNADQEFTVQEAVASSNDFLRKPFTSSHVSQMLSTLAEVGLVYKNRHGKYSLAVPLLGEFIQRQHSNEALLRVLE